MKNQTGRPIAPARKLVAWIIGTIAAFVIALGLGMSSSPVAFFGVAVLAIAVAVAFMPAPRRGGRATVAGTAEVGSISPPPVAGAYGRATIQLIVVAPGLGTFETTVREPRIPVEKWPLPGGTVPITVDVDDTRRVRVSWRDAPARLEGDDPPPPPPPAGRNEPDDLDDEVFGSVDEPWEGRDDDWEVDPDGPGPSSGTRGATTAYARRTGTPVVVRETAAGTIVEGHVVDTDEDPSPLPRRARPVQPETTAHATETTDEPPVRAAPAARTAPDPEIDPDADVDWSDPEPPWRAPSGTVTADDDTDLGPSGPAPSRAASSGVTEPETASRTTAPPPSAFVSAPQADPPPSTDPGPGPGPASGVRSPSGSASGRPPGSRPSPRPRGASATATAERDTPSGTAEAAPTTTTATATSGTVPPAQRTSTESRPDPAADIDLDLDGPPTGPVTTIPTQSTHGRTGSPTQEPTEHTDRTGPSTADVPAPDAPEPTSPEAFAETDTRTESPADPATSSSDTAGFSQARSTGPADPISPASRRAGSADPVSPAGRSTAPIDPVSPAGRSTRSGGRGPGLTPPPPPTARRADAPTPPPPPIARPSHAAAPPPPPSRSARSSAGSREQNAWARPASSTPASQPSPAPAPAPSPRSPVSADERWAPPTRPVSPAAQPSTAPRPDPEQAESSRPRPAPRPAGSSGQQPGPAPSDTARTASGPAPDDEDRWVPGIGPAASTVPPDVETRPLGSRTRFFAQPGEETESFATEDAEQAHTQPAAYPAQSRPEPTPSSSASTPSPVAPPPTAPEPDRPFPSAPAPATPRTAAPRPGIDQIDIPLDNFPLRGHTLPIDSNPAPAPEDEPQAATARADGIMASPAEQTPRPSALRDGILGVAVGRAAVSPDAFPTPHLDDVPAPGAEPGAAPERPSTGEERPSTGQGQAGASHGQAGMGQERAGTGQAQPGTGRGQAAASQGQPGPAPERSADGGEPRRNGPWGDFNGRPDEHAGDVITGYPSARPSTAASIHGVGITVLVTDLERSTEFYRDVLGFHEIDNGDGSAVLASGDTRLVLRTVHNLTAEAGRLIYLNLEVGDIEAVHAELREKGVKFVHSPRPVNRGDKLELWSATFRDPDNHNIAITQWRAIH